MRFWRPLTNECVALQVVRIEVAFDGPGVDGLRILLFDRFELKVVTVRRRRSQFFVEFALCGRERLFVLEFSFRNRPGPFVLLPPVWTTWMGQKHFEARVRVAIEQ